MLQIYGLFQMIVLSNFAFVHSGGFGLLAASNLENDFAYFSAFSGLKVQGFGGYGFRAFACFGFIGNDFSCVL
jgi:hypothetical protein